MTSIKKNFAYNIIYQILIFILPLITAPYVSRIIGTEGVGIYSYTYSIANYFVIFAMLGLNNYGNRCIAKCRDNKEKLSKEFSSIYVLQITTTLISIICYILYIFFFNKQYIIYSSIQLIYLLSAFFDINWLFFGLEKFKLTVTRNIIIKVLSVLSIFIIVKNKNDLVIYIFILAITSLFSQLSLWPFVKKHVKFVRPKFSDVKEHIRPNLTLFIPVIAISIYTIMDKIMLGNMSNMSEVGLYENAEKILSIPHGFIIALGTVMLPRISNLVGKGEEDKSRQYINKSMKFVLFVTVPVFFGLMTISVDFAPIYFGVAFEKTGYLIKYLAIIIVLKAWANVIRTQCLIPKEKDKPYIVSVILGAITNLILNLILIPRYQSVGAVIGTVCAELVVMVYQTYIVRKDLPIMTYFKYLLRFFISGFIMYICIILLQIFIENKYVLIISQVILGVVIYCILNFKYIMENVKNISIKKLKKII